MKPIRLSNTHRRIIAVVALAILSLALPITSHADFTQIPDPAFQACLNKLASKNGWDQPADFTDITCHNNDIRSIEGIRLFVNLKKLSLYKNQLHNAKISGLGKLAHLNLAGNSLSELHLANLAALEECYVFNNELTTLSIKNTPRLIKLKANNNRLKELHFASSEGLSKLYIFDNKLEKVDMKTLPHLSYFDARHNPMPDEFYDLLDSIPSLTALHDGNAEDWN